MVGDHHHDDGRLRRHDAQDVRRHVRRLAVRAHRRTHHCASGSGHRHITSGSGVDSDSGSGHVAASHVTSGSGVGSASGSGNSVSGSGRVAASHVTSGSGDRVQLRAVLLAHEGARQAAQEASARAARRGGATQGRVGQQAQRHVRPQSVQAEFIEMINRS